MKLLPSAREFDAFVEATIKLLPNDFSLSSLIQFAIVAAGGFVLAQVACGIFAN